LAFVLDGEVDERGGASESGGDGAGLEVVGAGGAAERHVEMGVDVDAARDDQAAGGVLNARGVLGGSWRRCGNLVSVDSTSARQVSVAVTTAPCGLRCQNACRSSGSVRVGLVKVYDLGPPHPPVFYKC